MIILNSYNRVFIAAKKYNINGVFEKKIIQDESNCDL